MRGLRAGLPAGAILIAIVAASCHHESSLPVRYLPGMVPGSQHVLAPSAIIVLPVTGPPAAGEVRVGSIYNPDGSVKTPLAIKDIGTTLAEGVARCLSDAGLKASLAAPGDTGTPASVFALATRIESISVEKHFAAEQTIHGQYFKMVARVKLRFTLSKGEHRNLYSVVTTGTETEPPEPVGGEVFLPIETEPAESLSVAMSRAIGALILEPGFRNALAR